MGKAMTQDQHLAYNERHWPGTRQMCVVCDEPTGYCEEDGFRNEDGEPLCEDCYDKEGE